MEKKIATQELCVLFIKMPIPRHACVELFTLATIENLFFSENLCIRILYHKKPPPNVGGGGLRSNRGRYNFISRSCFFRLFGGPVRQSSQYYLLFLALPTRRRETIHMFEYFFGVRVFWPFPDGLPQRVLALRSPRPCAPSPPPYG